MIDVNIKGALYGIAAALPYMKERKAGRHDNHGHDAYRHSGAARRQGRRMDGEGRRERRSACPSPVATPPDRTQSSLDLEKFVSVFQRQFAKHIGLGESLEHGQRFPRHALATHASRRRVVVLADATAVSVLTGTIAAKDEFVLMAREKVSSEVRV